MTRIYLDHNATTPLDPRVLKAMLADLGGFPANPSSVHYFGQQARAKLEISRKTISSFFHVKPEELIFTSGGTESLNLILRGFFGSRPKGHLITTAIEHSAMYRTIQILEGAGLEVTYLPLDSWGVPLASQIALAIKPNTCAFAFSAANNETGAILDIKAIADLAYQREIPLILDFVAYIGKEKFFHHPGISAMSISGHKFHAPKGIGCAIIRRNFKCAPLITGGGQEFQKRAGTENLAGILGLQEAFSILQESQESITKKIEDLRSHFERVLLKELPDVSINAKSPRVCNTSNLCFKEIDGETLLIHLDMAGIAASHGSACSSGSLEPSRVLLGMGLGKQVAKASLRFSFSRFTTKEEIDMALERIIEIVRKLRS